MHRRRGGIGMVAAGALLAALAGCADTESSQPEDASAQAGLNGLQDALMRCWALSEAKGQPQETVSVWFQLDENGRVLNTKVAGSKDPWLAKMQERARRAVVRCQPYELPGNGDRPPVFTATFHLPPRPAAGDGEPLLPQQ
jgi:hypothetical protein